MPDDRLDEIQDTVEEEATPAPRRSILKLFAISSFTGILGASIFLGAIFLKPQIAPAEKPGAASSSQQDPFEARPCLFELGDIIVNLSGTEGRRYLKLQLMLELKDKKFVRALEERQAYMRDRLIMVLADKTLADVDGSQAKKAIRQEIRDEMNLTLKTTDVIQNVYFTDFLVQ